MGDYSNIRALSFIRLGKFGDGEVLGTGRCEKIDLETSSNFGPGKKRARMRYTRSLGLRHTFRFKRNFSQVDFFTSSRPAKNTIEQPINRELTETLRLCRYSCTACTTSGSRSSSERVVANPFLCRIFTPKPASTAQQNE
jgi:hypothetical protein